MTKAKIVYCGEWVKVQNFMNKHFNASQPCELCRSLKIKPVWYSIKSKKVRCTDCFNAEKEHFK